MNINSIYYEANTVEKFKDCALELLSTYENNTYEYKDSFCNLREKTVLGTKINYDSKNTKEYQEQVKAEIIDHIDTLSEELKKMYRTYTKKDEEGKVKRNNEAVLIKIGLPYHLCEHKPLKTTDFERAKKIKSIKNRTKELISDEKAHELLEATRTQERKNLIRKICKELIKDLKPSGYTLPYLAFSVGEGNKHYLYILYVDKQYYQNEKIVPVYAKSKRYRDDKSYITEEKAIELGLENVTTLNVGDKLYDKKVKWSAKVTNMWFGCRSSLEAKRHTFKSIIASIFKRFNITLDKVKERWINHIRLKDSYRGKHTWKVVLYSKMYWFLYRKNIAINGLIDTFNTYYEKGELQDDEKDNYIDITNFLVAKSRLNSNKFEKAIQAIRAEFLSNGYLDIEEVKELVKSFKTA